MSHRSSCRALFASISTESSHRHSSVHFQAHLVEIYSAPLLVKVERLDKSTLLPWRSCRLGRSYSHNTPSVICIVLAAHFNMRGESLDAIGVSQQPEQRSRTELKAIASVNPEIGSTGVIRDLAPRIRLCKTKHRSIPTRTNAECVDILSGKRCRYHL